MGRYDIERDNSLRSWEVTKAGLAVAPGVEVGTLRKVVLAKVIILDSMLKQMGESGFLDKYIRGKTGVNNV